MTRKRLAPILPALLPAAVFLLCLVFRDACATGVRAGLKTVAGAALPALFPFLLLSRALTLSTRAFSGKRIRTVTALVLGLSCGFPIGAKLAADGYRDGAFSRADAERLLFSCNGAGAAFLTGIYGAKTFGSVRAGWLLWGLQAGLSLLLYALYPLFFRKKIIEEKRTSRRETAPPPGAAEIWSEAITDSVPAFLTLGATILLFSFLTEVIFAALPVRSPAVKAVLALFLEIGGGAERLSALPANLAYPLAAASAGWAGVSVHLQSAVILRDSGLSAKPHLFGKAILSPLMALFAWILQKLLSI